MFGIIIDNIEQDHIVTMGDDGKGSSVHIPNFLINKENGTSLKEAIHKKVEPKMNR